MFNQARVPRGFERPKAQCWRSGATDKSAIDSDVHPGGLEKRHHMSLMLDSGTQVISGFN